MTMGLRNCRLHKIQRNTPCFEPNYTSPRTIGVYYRLNNIPLPGSYGPSADENF